MATPSKAAPPKSGQRVKSAKHEGVFEVVGVNSLMQTANIRLTDGTGHVVANVPWTELMPADKK